MCSETFHFTGKKLRIDSPLRDGFGLVREKHPDAIAEGSVSHYSYLVGSRIVAETWQRRDMRGWWLRFRHDTRDEGKGTD